MDEKISRMLKRMGGIRVDANRKNVSHPREQRRVETIYSHLVQGSTELEEPPRKIPVLLECDVLVVGAGPAGLSAAISASRTLGGERNRVVLVEKFGCFGGCITTVGMETLSWYRYEGTVDVQGIGIEMENLAAKMGGTIKFPYNQSENLDADFFKVVADKLVRENNILPLLHTYVVETLGGSVCTGVICESKSGRFAIKAKRVCDCTGDADLAFLAGARFHMLPKEEMLGVTSVFNLSGVDKAEFINYTESKPAYYNDWRVVWEQTTDGKEDSLRSPMLPMRDEVDQDKQEELNKKNIAMGGTWSSISDQGEATNLNLVYQKCVDGLNVFDLTNAEIEGRTQAMDCLKILKKKIPGFEKAKLRNFGMTLGVRDTRKIIGRYNLTAEDVQNQLRRPEETVGIFPEFIDGYSTLILPTTGRYFHVPYGTIVSPDVDNMLVAGRCCAGDKMSHAAMRNMMACCTTGQAAGVACAVSILNDVSTSNVDIKKVQAELIRQGVRIY